MKKLPMVLEIWIQHYSLVNTTYPTYAKKYSSSIMLGKIL